MHYDVKICGARIEPITYGSESECAIHYTTAPHRLHCLQCPIASIPSVDQTAAIRTRWEQPIKAHCNSVFIGARRTDRLTD